MPFTIYRDIIAYCDETETEIILRNVSITVEEADFSKETVEEEGFSGEWIAGLSEDRFSNLPESVLESAMDACSNVLEDLAGRIANEGCFPIRDESKLWHYKSNNNI